MIRPRGGPAGAEEVTYEHLGLGYLAGYLEQHGVAVDLYDAVLEDCSIDEIAQRVRTTRPALVGITVPSQRALPSVSEHALAVKTASPQTHICIGGHFPTQVPELLMRDFTFLDSVVRGEGEKPLLELATRLINGQPVDGVPSLTHWRGDEIVSEPLAPTFADIDEIPFPRRRRLPLRMGGVQYATIVSSRGCDYKCTFCSIHAFYDSAGLRWRMRSVNNVVREMVELRERWGCTGFFFADDNFLRPGAAGLARALEFRNELRAAKMDDCIIIALLTANAVRDEVIAPLVEVGLRGVFLGIESASPQILKRLRKPSTAAMNGAALRLLGRYGLDVTAGFIMFDPDTTLDDLRINITFLRDHLGFLSDTNVIGRLDIYAGTPAHAEFESRGRLSGSYLEPQYEFSDAGVDWVYAVVTAVLGRWAEVLENWTRGPRGRLTSAVPAATQGALWRQRTQFMLEVLETLVNHAAHGHLVPPHQAVELLVEPVDRVMQSLTRPLGVEPPPPVAAVRPLAAAAAG
ncbi:MAG TPA: radical SAM protein [Dongiaceae bacterium]|nr:radical SAM protein [Dongiaceae bacterium]